MTSVVPTGSHLRIGSSYNDIIEKPGSIFNQLIKTAGFPHDPNSKTVYPPVLVPYNGIAQKLEYTIRFQNEGDAPANTVTLIDMLDLNYLDPSTLIMVDSEYPFEYGINHTTGQLSIEFNEINLPGLKQSEPYRYTYDETESYIVFEICTFPIYFEHNECIKNKVDIIFDTQPAITTKPAISCAYEEERPSYTPVFCGMDMSKISDQDLEMTSDQELELSYINTLNRVPVQSNISIFPNPFTDEIVIRGLQDSGSKVQLINSTGQVINTLHSNGKGDDIMKVNDIPNGLYFILYQSNGKRIVEKIVK